MAHLYQRGRQYWISYYLNGKLIQKSLKTKNERVAVSKKNRIEYELSTGDLHVASKLKLPVILTVYCRYLEKVRTFKSYKNDISRLRIFFGPICDSLKPYPSGVKRGSKTTRTVKDKYEDCHVKAQLLEDITPEVINNFLADRMEHNSWKPKTVNLMRQTLHRLFSYAIKHHGFRSRDRRYPNPAAGVERIRESAPQITFLQLEQIPEQLKILKDSPVIFAMVAVYIYAGLRREEAIWLTSKDIDLKSRLIRVQSKTIDGEFWQPKTKKNRVVPISNQLYEILKDYQVNNESIWFFSSPTGKRWDPDNFSHDLRKLNKKAGLPWSCLDFRHTFGSQLAQKGESLYKISELMGNSPEICRKHYAALVPEKMQDTVEFGISANKNEKSDNANIESMLKQVLEKLGDSDEHKPKIRLVK